MTRKERIYEPLAPIERQRCICCAISMKPASVFPMCADCTRKALGLRWAVKVS